MQASFLNEINWKIEQDLVFPYHYRPEEYKHALERIAALMERVDDDVIFTAPRSSEFLNHFFVSMKPSSHITCTTEERGITLNDGDRLLLCRRNVIIEFYAPV